MAVTVVLAEPARQQVVALSVPAGTTAAQAVALSGLLAGRPEAWASQPALAVYGRKVEDTHPLEAGDRVEILRPLPEDPKLRRRNRARRGAVMGRRG